MRLFHALMLLVVVSSGCGRIENFYGAVDSVVFRAIGGTVFSKPDQVTLKEIHLDKGALVGQEVMVEGQVIETGRYDTYMVMSDTTARMLVVLTDVDDTMRVLSKDVKVTKTPVKIIGTVEYGKKGLPFIQARSFMIRDHVNESEEG